MAAIRREVFLGRSSGIDLLTLPATSEAGPGGPRADGLIWNPMLRRAIGRLVQVASYPDALSLLAVMARPSPRDGPWLDETHGGPRCAGRRRDELYDEIAASVFPEFKEAGGVGSRNQSADLLPLRGPGAWLRDRGASCLARSAPALPPDWQPLPQTLAHQWNF